MESFIGRNKMITRLAVFFIVALGLYVAAYELGKDSYHNDELALLYHQAMPLPKLLEFCRNWAFHPPLFFFVLKGWVNLVGEAEASTRFLSVLFFLIMAILPFWYRRILNFPWWLFSLLLVFSCPLLLLSRMVEPYSLASLFCLATWLQILKWQIRPNMKDGGLVVLGLTLCFYSHYLAWVFCIIFCTIIFFQFLMKKDTEAWKAILCLGMGHLLLILPWITYNLSFKTLVLAQNIFWNIRPSMATSLEEVFRYLSSREERLIWLWALVVLANIVFSKKSVLFNSLLILWMALFFLAIILRSLGPYSYILPRYFVWLVPVIYYLFLASLPKKGRLLLFALFFGLQVQLLPEMYDDTWSEAREPFIYTAMQGNGERCEKKVHSAWYNNQWFKPYIKRYGRCGVELINEEICLKGFDSIIKGITSPSLVIYQENFCPEVFGGLSILNPEYGGIIYFKNYRLLVLGQSAESYLKEINTIPQIGWSF